MVGLFAKRVDGQAEGGGEGEGREGGREGLGPHRGLLGRGAGRGAKEGRVAIRCGGMEKEATSVKKNVQRRRGESSGGAGRGGVVRPRILDGL